MRPGAALLVIMHVKAATHATNHDRLLVVKFQPDLPVEVERDEYSTPVLSQMNQR